MKPFDLPYPADQHEGRLLLGDPVAEAYEWLNAYSKKLDEPVDKIVALALYTNRAWNDYIMNPTMGSNLRGTKIDPDIWDKIQIFYGVHVPKASRRSTFP